jgi:hypothetical protein
LAEKASSSMTEPLQKLVDTCLKDMNSDPRNVVKVFAVSGMSTIYVGGFASDFQDTGHIAAAVQAAYQLGLKDGQLPTGMKEG